MSYLPFHDVFSDPHLRLISWALGSVLPCQTLGHWGRLAGIMILLNCTVSMAIDTIMKFIFLGILLTHQWGSITFNVG